MPRPMAPRLRFLLIAWLAGLVGAALEVAEVASLRPWIGTKLARAAVEIGVLWSAATLGFAALWLLVGFRSRSRPEPAPPIPASVVLHRHLDPIGALLVAPAVWCLAWLLEQIDPRAQIEIVHLAIVTLALVGAVMFALGVIGRFTWRAFRIANPLLLIVLILAASGYAFRNWRSTTPRPGDAPAGAAAPPSVLLISLDTLRADHLGAYGCARGLSPRLDALAKEGVVFASATCPMPLTAPSHVAMLTGLMPHESGVPKNGQPLPRDTASVPRLLAKEGYVTAAFVSGFPLFERSSHLAGHFHHYDDEFDADPPLSEGTRLTPFGHIALRALRKKTKWQEPTERAGDATVERALAWYDTVDAARPTFVFCHLYDVHAEYIPHEPGQKRSRFWDVESSLERLAVLEDESERKLLQELYDGEVRFVDEQVGRLVARLRQLGRLDRTLVIVTSDHGESLGEHDFWYEHINPYHVETHVPLILRLPGGANAGTRVEGPAQLTDLAATMRDLLDVSIDVPGQSLASAIAPAKIPRRLVFSQSMFDFTNAWFAVSVRDGRFKLVRRSAAFERYDSRRVPATEQLFDLTNDPGETVDLLAKGTAPEEARLDELRERLDEYMAACIQVGPTTIDPEVAAQLKQLGY